MNEKIILCFIVLNSIVIFLQESNIENPTIQILDIGCTLIFIIEMVVKHLAYGVKGYWKSGWNRLDGTLVILSVPSILVLFFPIGMSNLSMLLILRLLRVFRFFRIVHIFPDFSRMVNAFKLAMRESYAILLSFFTIIIIFSLINCALFKDLSPIYFSSPLNSAYSIFRICTVEGWYEIPNTIAEASSPVIGHFVRIYFCFMLLLGGIIGMSFFNSVFVDAMVSDNNDEIKEQISRMEEKIDRLLEEREDDRRK